MRFLTNIFIQENNSEKYLSHQISLRPVYRIHCFYQMYFSCFFFFQCTFSLLHQLAYVILVNGTMNDGYHQFQTLFHMFHNILFSKLKGDLNESFSHKEYFLILQRKYARKTKEKPWCFGYGTFRRRLHYGNRHFRLHRRNRR